MATRGPNEPPRRETPRSGLPVRFGRYRLERRLAVGGMAEVFLARLDDDRGGGLVVIKRLLPALLADPASRGTFATEAKLHAAVHHPNVVDVHEAGDVDGEPYLALEWVEGVDLARLLHRMQTSNRRMSPGLAVYVARELAKALACVHAILGDDGELLGVVHRDVTPSNAYLSRRGEVKLGDFGIARSTARGPRTSMGNVLKGKYGYLSPEQVAGDASDHRSDLFSLGVVLAEMLIGQPLFPGAGQLAVLLAIRDCRLDPLHASAALLPSGLTAVLEKTLAKNPADRFATADDLEHALAPWQKPDLATLRAELASLVAWASEPSDLEAGIARNVAPATSIREAPANPTPRVPSPVEHEADDAAGATDLATVAPPAPLTSNVRTATGRVFERVAFAKLVELIVTGVLSADDEVDLMGDGFRPIADVEVLARHLGGAGERTTQLVGPGVPDYAAELAETSFLEVLAWMLSRLESGVIFVDRPEREGALATRKEIYLERSKLVMVASSDASEMLGEYLLRREVIDRAELDLALLMMPKFGGRLGDTLIGLGLVDPVHVFRAIRHQGRDRVAEIFSWSSGRVMFYRGVSPQRVDFRLDLDVPAVMLAGLDVSWPGDEPVRRFESRMESVYLPVRPPPPNAKSVTWPAPVIAVHAALATGRKLGEVLAALANERGMRAPDALRALAVALAGGIVHRADARSVESPSRPLAPRRP